MPRGPNATCSVCSKPVYRSHSSRPEIVCRDCRRKQPGKHGRNSSMYLPKPCAECGEIFQPTPRTKGKPPHRYCSKSCGSKASNRARDQPRTNGAGRKAATRRRRMIVATTWDGVTDEQILERDKWMCWICKRRIGKTLKWPHPRSASIDHELPLALGGDDTQYNKRAAHLYCNMARQTGRPGEQMPMAFALDHDMILDVKQRAWTPRFCSVCGERYKRGGCPVPHALVAWCNDCGKSIPNARSNAKTCKTCRDSKATERKIKKQSRVQTCAVPTCLRRPFGAGYCNAHYSRWIRLGDPLPDVPIQGDGTQGGPRSPMIVSL